MTLRRFFVVVDGRTVHGRRAGSGPPLLLLHQSPRSSAELEPLMAVLAAEWDVIAPDTPGNGLSDAFGGATHPLSAYADATARLLDVLGVVRCALYGFHTGAAIGCALAVRHPARIVGAVLNGLPAFDGAERADLAANYLPDFAPRWDGAHLAWAWARLREQTIFFPWYRGLAANRMAFDIPDPATLTANLVELCRAGPAYRGPYGAAFADAGVALARHLRVPAHVVATARDPLHPHLARLTGLPAPVTVATIAPGFAPIADLLRPFRQSPASAIAAVPQGPDHIGYAGSPGAQCCWHRRGWGDGATILFHDLGEDGSIALARRAADTDVLAIDQPGHGASDAARPDMVAGQLALAIEAIGTRIVAVATRGEAVDIARLALPGHTPQPATPRWSSARRASERAAFRDPDFAGGHLALLWHRARDMDLFEPWHSPTAAAAIVTADAPDPAWVQRVFLASLVAAPAVRAALGH